MDDFEQEIYRYFELEKVLKNESNNLSEIEICKLNAEYKKLDSNFFNLFMVVRVKLGLDPELKFKDWIRKEYDQIIKMKKLLGEVDDLLSQQ
jgi:hypothetical protein